ncbi:V-type ATP synthase subunit D [Alkalitalea saponilacus]|uniref:V/A-type H+-transporting ATPase subunit D n=1 Tax=Alkalitalea saponilacus TaxID=889453 RepID=A0A1T5B9T2_9BACT|nr:V-type ATP synthase subunit D [Alkalitalea saponilacus]ASB49746.1 V-type ATP synthase subunit D [Alkalitalea saponilacus]SKB43720.1 V/A-type H+-transporting ATPase subunit D [Alkalitalea saponilacus]
MAIKFQYNKTSLQTLDKQLKVRQRALPTLKNKESALRSEVKRARDMAAKLEKELEQELRRYDDMVRLWGEFDASLLRVEDVILSAKKIAGVQTPMLDEVRFDIAPYNPFNKPVWFPDGIDILRKLAEISINREVWLRKMELLEHARKKTTQKVNLYEKVQIPGFEDAMRKIKRFLEDEENLSKSAQKIVKTRQEQEVQL